MSVVDRNDPIRRGMTRQLESRRQALQSGAKRLGWKAGLGTAPAMERFGLQGPLVGYLTDATLVNSGDEVPIQGWTRPVLEPEIAVYLGNHLSEGEDEESIRTAIAAVGPAIELADVHPPPEDLEVILAGNIFHRRLVLGESDQSRAGGLLDGLTARLQIDGADELVTTDLEAFSGKLVEVLGHMAEMVAAVGHRLEAGDVVIAGSVVPPLDVTRGQQLTYELLPFDPISVNIR